MSPSARLAVPAILSAAVWSVITVVLGWDYLGDGIWGGVMVLPLILLWSGMASRDFRNLPILWRMLFALASLYLAATGFGFGMGLLQWLVTDNAGAPQSVIAAALIAVWRALTVTGAAVLLWPFAYANHLVFAAVWQRRAAPVITL